MGARALIDLHVEIDVHAILPTISVPTLILHRGDDIVDSTATAARLGDRAWRDLIERHDATVRHHLHLHRGHEVKTMGDGFLATFDGPARAIRCATSLRDALGPLDLRVRAGIHTGEVELIGDDVAGMAVNIGARIGALAGAGEVYVSSTVKELVVGRGWISRSAGCTR